MFQYFIQWERKLLGFYFGCLALISWSYSTQVKGKGKGLEVSFLSFS